MQDLQLTGICETLGCDSLLLTGERFCGSGLRYLYFIHLAVELLLPSTVYGCLPSSLRPFRIFLLNTLLGQHGLA